LVGPAVERPVAAFHRLDAQGVASTQRADGNRTKEGAEVTREPQPESQGAGGGLQVVQRMELEEASHGRALGRRATGQGFLTYGRGTFGVRRFIAAFAFAFVGEKKERR